MMLPIDETRNRVDKTEPFLTEILKISIQLRMAVVPPRKGGVDDRGEDKTCDQCCGQADSNKNASIDFGHRAFSFGGRDDPVCLYPILCDPHQIYSAHPKPK